MKNKKFIQDIITLSFLLLIIRSVFAGVLQAVVVFFTKKKLEDWEKSKEKI